MRPLSALAFFLALTCAAAPLRAQSPGAEAPAPAPIIETADDRPTDERIEADINDIFGQIEALTRVEASVRAGVVTLTGHRPRAEGDRRTPRNRRG